MKEFKAKEELLFVMLPETAKDIISDMGYIIFDCLAGKRKWLKFQGISGLPGLDYYDYHRGGAKLPQGNWQLLGQLKSIPEDMAMTLVEELKVGEGRYMNYANDYPIWFHTATASLQSIALHLGFELTDNIYILTKNQ